MSTPYLFAIIFSLAGGVTWGIIYDMRRPLRRDKPLVRRLAMAAATSALILICVANGAQLALALIHFASLLPAWTIWATLFAFLTTAFLWIQA